jgi:hypothetical protein
MKQFYFNLQSKGGAGKSMLTYLLALKNETNEQSYFCDVDSSVKSSTQQLKFLQGKTPPRFAAINLLDARNKIDRQLLFDNLMQLVQKDYRDYYLDFGAPESTEFPFLFSADYTIEEFKQIADELNAEFIFNIVIAGGSSYEACTNYLQTIVELVKGNFEINIYINEATFINKENIREIYQYAQLHKDTIHSVKAFGDFDNTTSPHKNILKKIEEGKGLGAYAFVERIKILKEIEKV